MDDVSNVWAHSANDADARHLLVDHVRRTAALAARFTEPFGGAEVAWWLGLLHDAGKASCAWQEGLLRAEVTDRPVGIDHKLLGAQLALERGLGRFALAVQGHHGGLTSPGHLRTKLAGRDQAALARDADAERRVRTLLPELARTGEVVFPSRWTAAPLVGEMALRLVFSALCDADFLDTAAHFADAAEPSIRADTDFGELARRFEARRADLLDARTVSEIDPVRTEVYRACVDAASLPRGIFRLAAPTGAGKTLSAGAFALHHAAAHGLRRVIVAVPYLTITEQNAAVYRSLLDEPGGEPVVLEHHSQVDLDDGAPGARWHRLAAENWDAPFVVTTTVRLLESLFGRKPAAMRRVHRLASAVIVLDEVQALPHRLLVPILDGLRLLVEHFGTTVLLSSATQPEFWALDPFRDLPDATDIVPDADVLASRLRRVRYEWHTEPSLTVTELADDAATRKQALVVLNTTADAEQVYRDWAATVSPEVAWHLSTRMCPAHRRRVLDEVRVRLARGEPTLLVSTQLIEAGVDVDFPVVYRALAPADSLLQSAGRANREGNLPDLGLVVLVDPPDAGQPPSYRTLVNITKVHFGPGKADPNDIDALRHYYRSIYQALNLDHPSHIGQRIQAARQRFDFHTVTDGPADPVTNVRDRTYAFRMITDDGIAVITPQGAADASQRDAIRRLVDNLRTAPRPDMATIRRLQPYITTVHRSALRRPGVQALLRPVFGEPGQPGALTEWDGDYDAHTGITLDPHTEDFVL